MESKLQTYITQETGQIISFDGIAADAGQCVQNVSKWCEFIGLPVEWANAADWFLDETSAFSQKWTKVVNNPNDASQEPSAGDLVVFSPSLPGSGGYGHIDIYVKKIATGEWQGFDSNWDGLPAKLVTHNWSYVLGWYTPTVAPVIAPAPAPVPLPATPASAPTTAAVSSAAYQLDIAVKGYGDANDAANHTGWNGKTMVAAGTYSIFNEDKGMVNVTSKVGQPGSWINPADENVPAPAPPAPTPTPPAPAAPTDDPVSEPDTTTINEQVTVTTDTLNVRLAPNVSSEAKEANTSDGSLHNGNIITVTGWVHGENVSGNDVWLRSVRGNWVWSGGTNFNLAQTQVAQVTAETPAVLSTTPPVVKPQMVNNVATALAANGGETIPVKVTSYQDSFNDKKGAGTYKTIEQVTVTDFSGKGDPIVVPKGTLVESAGTFSKDGGTYARSESSVQKGTWYGFPTSVLVAAQNPQAITAGNVINDVKNTGPVRTLEDDLDADLDDLWGPKTSSAKEHLIAGEAKAEGLVSKIFKRK